MLPFDRCCGACIVPVHRLLMIGCDRRIGDDGFAIGQSAGLVAQTAGWEGAAAEVICQGRKALVLRQITVQLGRISAPRP